MKNTSQRRIGELWWWAVGITVVIGLAVGWYLKSPSPIPSAAPPPPTKSIALHKPVYVRVGTIVSIARASFELETTKLESDGTEVITIRTTPLTAVMEVRVLEFIDPASTKVKRDDRAKVPFTKLYRGQRVAVISNDDMYGQSEVAAAQIEYLKLI